jgi:hypothetical protein
LRIRIVSRKNAIGPGLILVSLSRDRDTGGGQMNGCAGQEKYTDVLINGMRSKSPKTGVFGSILFFVFLRKPILALRGEIRAETYQT